ncbi:nucleoside hydrolase [Pseudochrobactrum sp. HB0163]|uniref:nucleoside hydrolase n=1 Tax=Pseudochrobactrum sp. HB0163 TaxID=3450708 RepID=UPI003F6E3B21
MGVWIDTDMGFDDIAAILVVKHQGLDIDGISLVFGNTELDQVCRNAAGAAQIFGWDFPVCRGRAKPVLGKIETAASILGETGIPTLGLSLPVCEDNTQGNAFAALCNWLKHTNGSKRVLALGPLTNIAALALARPDLAAKIDELVWMGGGIGKGNHTAAAEFNAFADPEALAIILAHNLPLKMVELDFCRRILASPQDAEPIRAAGGTNAALLADMTGGFINIAVARGRTAMALYDPAAAVAFACPDLVRFDAAFIGAELCGSLTRGRTVVETRASHASFNAAYAADGDVQTIRAIIFEALIAEAAKK